jgi:3-oxoacyl-[acyl-carrier-protein] synthase II
VLDATSVAVGEGCAVFVVEDEEAARAAGRRPLARMLACETAAHGDAGLDPCLPDGLAACISRALDRAWVAPAEVCAVAVSSTGDPVLDEIESTGVSRALGAPPPRVISVKAQVGECYSASGALQLAALLAELRDARNGGPPRAGLVTSVSRSGAVGCALVREPA